MAGDAHAPRWLRWHAWLVYGFLLAPIAVLVVFSFSASRFSAVWGGFTLDWYARLAHNERINFNAGDHSISESMACADYLRVEQPELGTFAEA